MDDPNDPVYKNGVDDFIKIQSFHRIDIGTTPLGPKDLSQKQSQHLLAKQEFEFDAVFGTESTQEDLFKEVYHLVMSAMDGYKVCIFAYGQTGSGKTYTMEGNFTKRSERGIIPRAVEAVFNCISNNEDQGWSYQISATFQEVY